MKQGLLVAFEGLDNSGKSTLIQRLARRFNSELIPSTMTRELTTSVGKLAIKYIKRGASPKMKALLFAADRLERQLKDVEPALSAGKIVFADRWFFSALAYRLAETDGQGQKEMENYVKGVNRYNLKPNLTFFIDITPAESIKRGRPIGKNNYTSSFLQKVRTSYLHIFSDSKTIILDGKLSLHELEDNICKLIKSKLSSPKR
jgi:dTMP kinase